jgi:hypothetical protein
MAEFSLSEGLPPQQQQQSNRPKQQNGQKQNKRQQNNTMFSPPRLLPQDVGAATGRTTSPTANASRTFPRKSVLKPSVWILAVCAAFAPATTEANANIRSDAK